MTTDFDSTDIDVFEPGDRVWVPKGGGTMRAVIVRDDGGPFVVVKPIDSNRSNEHTVRREKVGLG